MADYNEKYLWIDPVPENMRTGVLLSDQIQFFVDTVHLISPNTFVRRDLRPAAYDLHIGDTYYVDDQPQSLRSGQLFDIPANGLAYVKIKETFNLPYYILARYSLRVTQVYRGLLIDNGLHIDPGYHGPIYIPVHNFADERRVLSEGEAFLSVEFTRTTPLPLERLKQARSEFELMSLIQTGLTGYGGYELMFFNKTTEDLHRPPRTPVDFWRRYPAEKHKSAMIGTEQRLADVRAEVREQLEASEARLRNIGFFASLGILVAFLAIILPWISKSYFDTERAYRECEQKVQTVLNQIQELRKPSTPGLQSPPREISNPSKKQ